MRGVRIGLRRLATALAAAGAALLLIAPLLPLAEGAPADGLQNTLFWRTPLWDWGFFVLTAVAVPLTLAFWDSGVRVRAVGAFALAAAGVAAAAFALSLASSDLFERCSWGYPNAGLTTGFMQPCVGLSGRYEEAEALGTAVIGGTFLVTAGLLLPITSRFGSVESERRRRRLRSLVYF